MRVLVCGGRKYGDASMVYGILDGVKRTSGVTAIIEGGATGADALARKWAKNNGLVPITETAAWSDLTHRDAVLRNRQDGSQYDARAGIRRNQLMLDKHKPQMCIVFPGGDGTADMCRRARAAGITVVEVSADQGTELI